MLTITRHAAQRLRKRMGLNRRSLQRFVNRAEIEGRVIEDGRHPENNIRADYYLVHAGAILVVRDSHIVTAYPLNTVKEPEVYA